MEDWIVLTHATRLDEVNSILYGLSLRGLKAAKREAPRRAPEPWEILIQQKDEPVARSALPSIWDAVLELPRAIRQDGTCPFCGYDNIGVPEDRPCPECGVHLSSVAARRAYRDGRTLRPRLD